MKSLGFYYFVSKYSNALRTILHVTKTNIDQITNDSSKKAEIYRYWKIWNELQRFYETKDEEKIKEYQLWLKKNK